MERNTKPKSPDEYVRWLCDETKQTPDQLQNRYHARVESMRQAVTASPFWQGLPNELERADAEFRREFGTELLMPNTRLELLTKPFSSVVDKAYRVECLNNENWPRPTGADPLEPANYHNRFHDLVRAAIYVRFLDGAPWLCERLEAFGASCATAAAHEMRALPSGYYAMHLSADFSATVQTRTWETENITFKTEIQIATMTQWVLRTLSHQIYQRQRLEELQQVEAWRWQPASEEFKATYLGHLLHQADGLMVELRSRQGGR